MTNLLFDFPVNSVHPIANEMKGSSEAEIHRVSRASILLCSMIYVATALFGYLLFGEKTASDILSNFDTDLNVPYSKLLCGIIRISYAIHIMLVFPLLNFSLRLNLDALLFPKAKALAEDTRRFSILTAVIIASVFIGSTLVPNIWVAFEFTGATATVCLGFIFPGLIALRWGHVQIIIITPVTSWCAFHLFEILLCRSVELASA